MNKKFLCGALLCAVAASTHAKIESNKTFMRSRDSLSHNLLMGLAGNSWRKDKKNSMGSTLSGTSYYRQSYNTRDLATYFGGGQAINDDQRGQLAIAAGESPILSPVAAGFEYDSEYLYSSALDHMATAGVTGGMFGKINFSPVRTEYGTHISWQQDLGFITPRLSLNIDIPVVRVNHNLNAAFEGYAHTEGTAGPVGGTLQNYFSGATLTKSSTATQQALKYMLIDGKSHGFTGVADIQVGLGYNFYSDPTFRINTKGYFVLPTNGKLNAINLFEPTLGSGHVAIGLNTKISAKLFRSEDKAHKVTGIAAFDFRYLFNADKTRTLGIYDFWFNLIATGSQYRNLATSGSAYAIPSANALTRTVTVNPGQIFDGVLGARYNYKGLGVSFFYNFHAHSNESVVLAPTSRWVDNSYYMLPRGKDVTSITLGSDGHTYGGGILQEGNMTSYNGGSTYNASQYYVTTAACTTGSDVTHKISAVGEWHYRNFYFPINMSVGADYEMAGLTHSNNGVHSWTAWSKLCICF